MYAPNDGRWKRWCAYDALSGGYDYSDRLFRCRIFDNGCNDQFSWELYTADDDLRAKASGEGLKTLDEAVSAVNAVIDFLLKGEFGKEAVRLINMPKCPHCGRQVGYSANGVTARLGTLQEDIDVELTLSGSHVLRIPHIEIEDFFVAEVVDGPETVHCKACHREITDRDFIDAIPFTQE